MTRWLTWCLVWSAVACSSEQDDSAQGGAGSGAPANPFSSRGDAGSGSSTSGADGAHDGLAPDECANGRASASRVRPTVTIVVDGSTSMEERYGGGGSRWDALRQALVDPEDGVVAQLESAVDFGLVTFAGDTGRGGRGCPFPILPVDPAPHNYEPIRAAFPGSPPGTFTPTGIALDLVFQALPSGIEAPDGEAKPQYVILATDGEPNDCEISDEELRQNGGQPIPRYEPPIQAALAGQRKGITMYVVSLATARGEFAEHLQQMANIGAGLDADAEPGATVYSPTTPEALADELLQLVGGALTCDVRLNGEVSVGNECMGSVTLDGTPLACNDPDGWTLLDPRHIRLQGEACERFTSDTRAAVTASFPCNVIDLDAPE